jgi:hypothetical protein
MFNLQSPRVTSTSADQRFVTVSSRVRIMLATVVQAAKVAESSDWLRFESPTVSNRSASFGFFK